MKLWIEIDENNRLIGYSTSHIAGFLEVEVKEEPINMGEWKYNGEQLVHDPDGYAPPEIPDEPSVLEEIKEENAELRQRMDLSDDALLELADLVLSVQNPELKGGE